ncbi:MAG: dihydrodipicolinate synthase family protein [Balneolaceae bacterium]
MNKTLKNPLRGIIPPMVTPLKNPDTLDIGGLERLIEHLLEGGIHGLFILGSTGEAQSLDYALRYELIEKTCSQVAGRIPVLVGISDTAVSESLRMAEKAAKSGAEAVVCAPPYYYLHTQKELIEYYQYLSGRSPLPLFLYNIPLFTKNPIEPETVKRIGNDENVIGLKDSSGNPAYFQKVVDLMSDQPAFSLLVGPEEVLMQSLLTGGHGGVHGGANLFPDLYVDLYEAAVEKDYGKMVSLHKRVLQICSGIYTVGESELGYLQGIKTVLSLMGICSSRMSMPFQELPKEQIEVIRERLKKLDVQNFNLE